jgi:hypothetical protein
MLNYLLKRSFTCNLITWTGFTSYKDIESVFEALLNRNDA